MTTYAKRACCAPTRAADVVVHGRHFLNAFWRPCTIGGMESASTLTATPAEAARVVADLIAEAERQKGRTVKQNLYGAAAMVESLYGIGAFGETDRCTRPSPNCT